MCSILNIITLFLKKYSFLKSSLFESKSSVTFLTLFVPDQINFRNEVNFFAGPFLYFLQGSD